MDNKLAVEVFALLREQILDPKNAVDVQQANGICEENHIDNGGELRFRDVINKSDVAVLSRSAKTGDIIGYNLLENKGNVLYTAQVAVGKDFQRGFGVGKKMYEYVERHAKGFICMSAHAHVTNIGSRKFHEDNGFIEAREQDFEPEEGFTYFVKPVDREKAIATFEEAKPEFAILEKKGSAGELERNI